jgi:HNH endonuclease
MVITAAADLLSGPGGLASYLRTRLTPDIVASVSLPLDVGAVTETIPVHLRRAVTVRDRHCRWPGCHEPAAACQPHHIIPRSKGGPTCLTNMLLLCSLCRRRHNVHYAELWVMPMPGFPAVVAGASVLLGAA